MTIIPATTTPAGGLRRLWEGWKRIARRLGDVQVRVMLTLFYFVILAPFALAVRAFSDPLGLETPPAWRPRGSADTDSVAHAGRQY